MKIFRSKYFTEEEESQRKRKFHRRIAGSIATAMGGAAGGLGTYKLCKHVEDVAGNKWAEHAVHCIVDSLNDSDYTSPEQQRHIDLADFYDRVGSISKKRRVPLTVAGALAGAGLTAAGIYGYKHHKNKKRKDKNE